MDAQTHMHSSAQLRGAPPSAVTHHLLRAALCGWRIAQLCTRCCAAHVTLSRVAHSAPVCTLASTRDLWCCRAELTAPHRESIRAAGCRSALGHGLRQSVRQRSSRSSPVRKRAEAANTPLPCLTIAGRGPPAPLVPAPALVQFAVAFEVCGEQKLTAAHHRPQKLP